MNSDDRERDRGRRGYDDGRSRKREGGGSRRRKRSRSPAGLRNNSISGSGSGSRGGGGVAAQRSGGKWGGGDAAAGAGAETAAPRPFTAMPWEMAPPQEHWAPHPPPPPGHPAWMEFGQFPPIEVWGNMGPPPPGHPQWVRVGGPWGPPRDPTALYSVWGWKGPPALQARPENHPSHGTSQLTSPRGGAGSSMQQQTAPHGPQEGFPPHRPQGLPSEMSQGFEGGPYAAQQQPFLHADSMQEKQQQPQQQQQQQKQQQEQRRDSLEESGVSNPITTAASEVEQSGESFEEVGKGYSQSVDAEVAQEEEADGILDSRTALRDIYFPRALLSERLFWDVATKRCGGRENLDADDLDEIGALEGKGDGHLVDGPVGMQVCSTHVLGESKGESEHLQVKKEDGVPEVREEEEKTAEDEDEEEKDDAEDGDLYGGLYESVVDEVTDSPRTGPADAEEASSPTNATTRALLPAARMAASGPKASGVRIVMQMLEEFERPVFLACSSSSSSSSAEANRTKNSRLRELLSRLRAPKNAQ